MGQCLSKKSESNDKDNKSVMDRELSMAAIVNVARKYRFDVSRVQHCRDQIATKKSDPFERKRCGSSGNTSNSNSMFTMGSGSNLRMGIKKLLNLNGAHFTYLADVSVELLGSEKEGPHVLLTSFTLPTSMQRPTWNKGQFRLIKYIHCGYGARVYKAFCLLSNCIVILKVYTIKEKMDLERLHLYREITVHGNVAHPNIGQFYVAFKEQNDVFIIMEYIDGHTVRSILSTSTYLCEEDAIKYIIHPVIKTLMYLHENGIVHRDLKPENMLLDTKGVLKLIDFGLAIDITKETANTRAGTLEYMAPEVLMCASKQCVEDLDKSKLDTDFVDSVDLTDMVCNMRYNTKVDTWALGILAYELLVGSTPFASRTPERVIDKLTDMKFRYPSWVAQDARDFIDACLCWTVKERPNIHQLMSHKWIRRWYPIVQLTPSNTSTVCFKSLDSYLT